MGKNGQKRVEQKKEEEKRRKKMKFEEKLHYIDCRRTQNKV